MGHSMKWLRRCLIVIFCLGAAIAAIPERTVAPLIAQSADPCSSVTASSTRAARPSAEALAAREDKRDAVDHDDRWRHLDSLWADRAATARETRSGNTARRPSPRADIGAAADIGDIAVLRDAGDMMILANPLDLADVALRLAPNALGGYDLAHGSYGFSQPLGSALDLT